MTKLFAQSYWPKVPIGKIYKFHYTDAGSQPDTTVSSKLPDMSSWFTWDADTGSLLYVDYDENMKWKDTWFIRFNVNGQIDEWRDDSPSDFFLCPKKKVVFKTPIGWSPPGFVDLGKEYTTYPKADTFKCCPPQFLNGTQTVYFEKTMEQFTTIHGHTFSDVVTMIYQQSFGSQRVGARYWMANGIGPVAVQWIGFNGTKLVITNRLDADWTIDNGTAKDLPA